MVLKLSQEAFGDYKWQIIALLVLGFLSSLLGGIGINALIPLFSLVSDQSGVATDTISRMIREIFSALGISFNIGFLLTFIIVLFIIKALLTFIFSWVQIKIVQDYAEKTRTSIFNKFLRADWSYLLKQKLGYLETVLMVDVQYASSLLNKITNLITVVAGLLIYILVAINISAEVTLWTLVIGGILFLVFKRFTYKVKVLAYQIELENKEMAHHVNESILGMKTIKDMSVIDQVAKKGKEYFVRLKKLYINIHIFKNAVLSVIQPVGLIFICLVFWFSYKSDNFNFAALAAITYLIQQIFSYFKQLQNNFQLINEAIPFLTNLLNHEKKSIKNEEKNNGLAKFEFNRDLQFVDVWFSYLPQKQILAGINFLVNKGDLVGIIGPSGVGKTTLVDLVLRLFNPEQGEILLDGKNILDIDLDQWRQNTGYVSQDMFLMNDTIANNIRFYDSQITDEEVMTAAKMANIYDFISQCQDGMNTFIGERGVMLSVGQRQRIVIARVLARKPQLLILDEATSALDNESEVKIQEVIKNLKGKITVLVIAHRLSTVADSDKLIVLDKGRVAEQGVPQELLADKDSYFFKVYNLRNN